MEFAITSLANVGIGIVSEATSTLPFFSFYGTEREKGYLLNKNRPTLMPDINQIFDLYRKGYISWEKATQNALLYGVPNSRIDRSNYQTFWEAMGHFSLGDSDEEIRAGHKANDEEVKRVLTERENFWKKTVDSQQNQIPIDLIIQGTWLGTIPRRNDPTNKAAHGGEWTSSTLSSRLGWLTDYKRDYLFNRPFVFDANTCRIINSLQKSFPHPPIKDTVNYQDRLGAAGLMLPRDREIFNELYTPVPPGELARCQNVYGMDDDDAEENLIRAGFTDSFVRDMMLRSRFIFPDPANQNLFQTRQVSNEEQVEKYGLNEGYDKDTPFADWCRRAGYDVDPNLPADAKIPAGSWPKAMWCASRALPGLGDMRAWLFRSNDPKKPNPLADLKGNWSWTETDIDNILSMSGYTEPFRRRFLRTLYDPIPIRLFHSVLDEIIASTAPIELVQLVGPDVLAWATSVFRTHGQSPDNAKIMALAAIQASTTKAGKQLEDERKSAANRMAKVALDGYEIGIVDKTTLENTLHNLGIDPTIADLEVMAVDGKVEQKIAREQLGKIGQAWHKGKINPQAASDIMTTLGVTPDRQTAYTAVWQAERNEDRIMLETSQITGLLKQGLIDADTALSRLINLGWDNADALVIIAELENGLLQGAAKAVHQQLVAAGKLQKKDEDEQAKLAAKQQAQTAKALAAQAKEAAAAGKARTALNKLQKATVEEVLRHNVAIYTDAIAYYTDAQKLDTPPTTGFPLPPGITGPATGAAPDYPNMEAEAKVLKAWWNEQLALTK